MTFRIFSGLRFVWNDQRGQSLPWLVFGFAGFLAMAGLVTDVGRAYVAHGQLQAATNAAALSAASVTYNTSGATVQSQATALGSGPGGSNSIRAIGTVNTTATAVCLNILMPPGVTCATSSVLNAVRVVQTSTVPTYFLRLIGMSSISIGTMAQAAMQGVAQKWNVAVILDATGSMNNVDNNCGGVTEFQCATHGIKSLLQVTDPCPPGHTSCDTADANFRVSLFAFPNVSTDTVAYDSNCGGTPNYMVYTLPLPSATSYSPLTYSQTVAGRYGTSTTNWTATYQIVDFTSDYWSNGTLNPSSSLVKAITGCMSPITKASSVVGGLSGAAFGGITYYASVVYAAQAALLQQQARYPGSRNAIILLSDGQANLVAATNDFPSEVGATLASGSSGYTSLTGNGTYPDTLDECQQAIVAAQAATNAGTTVYSVAYGSQQAGCTTGGGHTDKTLVATGNNEAFTLSTLTPCVVMENIASTLNTFYSDYNQSGSGSSCQDNSHSVVSLQDIFLSIASTFTNPQLLPPNAR
jgi:Putative Flp pilus-assembly TadE/G-like